MYAGGPDAGHPIIPLRKEYSSTGKNRYIHQFMALFQETMESDGSEKQVVKTVEDIITHVIQAHAGTFEDSSCTDDISFNGESLSLTALVDEIEKPTACNAPLQDIVFSYAILTVIAGIPKKTWEDNFRGMLMDTGGARGSSSGEKYYHTN